MAIYHAPGDPLPQASFGDIILTHSTFWSGRIIRFGQRLRFRKNRKVYAQWNHAILVTGPSTIVEALGHGVTENPLSKYQGTEFVLIPTNVTPTDRSQILAFSNSVLEKREKYGYVEILSLGLTLLIPLPIQFGSPDTMICSGFVASALTRAGLIWDQTPEYMMPADIAEHFEINH